MGTDYQKSTLETTHGTVCRNTPPSRSTFLKRGTLFCIALLVAVSGFALLYGNEPAFAAGKAKLSKTSLCMDTGTAAKLRVKNADQRVKWTVSNKKVVTIKRKAGRYKQSIVLKAGKKPGSCRVTAKIGHRTLKCKVTVTKAGQTIVDPPFPKPYDPASREVETLDLSGSSRDLTAASDLPEISLTEPSAAGDFSATYTDTAVRLLQETLKLQTGSQLSGNILLSPDSILTALAMTENGAAGDTQAEMQTALHKDLPLENLNWNLMNLHNRLGQMENGIYSSANSIWAKEGYMDANPLFLAKNKRYFDASFYQAPFDRQTAVDMNSWVYNNTRNMIPQIVDPDEGLSEDARMVLINATAFESQWAEPFLKDYEVDTDAEFSLHNGTKQKVTMLSRTENTYLEFPGGKQDIAGSGQKAAGADGNTADGNTEVAGGIGFVKPYYNGEIAFLGLLPPEGMDAAEYALTLTGADFRNAWENRQSIEVKIRLPEFKYDFSTSLKKVLENMGMPLAFTNFADFSQMKAPTMKEDLKISDVIHKTHIDLDRNGTKAAAATAVFMEKATAILDPPKPKEVYLDRPFIYALVDTKTGIPLFLGIVENAAAEDAAVEDTATK